MKFIQYPQKLEIIKHLARYKLARTPQQLDKKLNVSERTVERIIQHLRDSSYPITYNRFRNDV